MNYLLLELTKSAKQYLMIYTMGKMNLYQYIIPKTKYKKNIFLYKLNFENIKKNIRKIKEIIKKHKKIDAIINNVEMHILIKIF